MIYLPLEHLEERYTSHLDRDILDYLNKRMDFIYISPKTIKSNIDKGSFLDAEATLYRQFNQMKELIKLLSKGLIRENETIFVSDIWNFTLLSIPYLNFFTNRNLKIRGVLHAGSFTDTDFVRKMERVYKGFEDALLDICEEVYVGSNFIKEDVLSKRFVDENKIKVTGLPLDFSRLKEYCNQEKREPTIVFNGRNVDEKQPYLFELLQKKLPQYKYINTQKENLSKHDYYQVLSKAKCIVSFALQENFGYGVQEAVYLGCVPCLPNRLAYMEQFDKKYLYNSFDECVSKIEEIMNDKLPCPPCVVQSNEKIFDIWFKNVI